MTPREPNRPTVLHVLEAVRGGTSRHVSDIVRYVPAARHHVAVPPPPEARRAPGGALYDRAAIARMIGDGAVVHEVPMQREPWQPENGLAVPRLRALIRLTGADAVHAHSAVGGAVGRLAARSAGVPVAYTPNGVAVGRLYRGIERALGTVTDRWIAVSPSEAAVARAGRLARPERIAVIPNGISLKPQPASPEDLRDILGLPPDTRLVGTVARLVPQKSPLTFARTAARIAAEADDVHFLLIGMGPLQAEVDAEVAGSGLGHRWHQIRHVEDAGAQLGQLDVFVLASSFEGGPYTPLEAMRAGTPVVVTDVVGSRDTIEDGRSGLLCPPGDVTALSGAVLRLLADPDLRRRLTAAASARLADLFDVEKMGRRLADLYRALITAR